MKPAVAMTTIQTAESADYEKLPQIDDLCQRLKGAVTNAKSNAADAEIQAMMIAREICEYAARPDVVASVDVINAAKKLQPDYRGGSPIKAHRHAMNAVMQKCGVSRRTIYNWMTRWQNVAKTLNLPVNCDQQKFFTIAESNADKHLWLESLTPETTDETLAKAPVMTPEKIAAVIGKAFLKAFMDEKGHVRLDKKARVEVMREVNPMLGRIGFELAPVGSE